MSLLLFFTIGEKYMKKCLDIIWCSIGVSIAFNIVLSCMLYNRRRVLEEFDD